MKTLTSDMDQVLLPLGFFRRGLVWNREDGPSIAVIDIQRSKSLHAMTLNLGVLDVEVHELIWGKSPGEIVQEPECTVRARIGQLIGGRDLWWPRDDESTARSSCESLTELGLPFIERMKARSAKMQWLIEHGAGTSRYPLPAINLCVLQWLSGERSVALNSLANLQQGVLAKSGAWAARAGEVARRLEHRSAEQPDRGSTG